MPYTTNEQWTSAQLPPNKCNTNHEWKQQREILSATKATREQQNKNKIPQGFWLVSVNPLIYCSLR